ncbi:P-loop containing nucleoside triphosphate hydrolase protein [Pavlovales sp. CCMP2436]|nr:P-loop containing nucleoside triphosphate hydrolase protein [Pavlovales sp. CCMP2436]
MANDQFGGGAAGGNDSSVTESNAPGISFDEIAGIPHAKGQVLEVVDCLRNPQKYAKAGARCPRGVLLVGPPGTGKTLLAKAIASNSGASFIACSGSDFVEVFVGRGAARVRRVFERARAASPCVLFIDELDALGKQRSGPGSAGGASEEHEHAVIALLTELDGFSTASGVLAVGATNRFQVLDAALVRPGRFDRVIRLRLPDSDERAAILKVHMRKLALHKDVEPALLGARTTGLSGAELANLVNEAALVAVRHERAEVRLADFAEALSTYRASRNFGCGGGADVDTIETIDGPEHFAQGEGGQGEGGLPPALLAAILQQMQLAAQGGGQRAAFG